MVQRVECKKCYKLLGIVRKNGDAVIEIKCGKCKLINVIDLTK